MKNQKPWPTDKDGKLMIIFQPYQAKLLLKKLPDAYDEKFYKRGDTVIVIVKPNGIMDIMDPDCKNVCIYSSAVMNKHFELI